MIEYYLYYKQPVIVKKTSDGMTVVYKLNRQTGFFEQISNRIVTELLTDYDNVSSLSEAKFIQEVEKLRGQLEGEGTVYDLYATINAIEDKAKKEDRWLTAEEAAIVKKLREKTYQLFEQKV